MKRITLEELLNHKQLPDYREQYQYICELLDAGEIKPVKNSGKNGKTPALFRSYWLTEKEKADEDLLEELRFRLIPSISIDYYLAHPEIYRQERSGVLRLNHYLKEHKENLKCPVSINERSFEIWGYEKYISEEQGKSILQHCGIDLSKLNVYETTVPLAYYTHTKTVPQNLLILENKDPFYSMRRYLMDRGEEILGVPVGTLIFGAGKGIFRSFQDFDLCAENYMKHPENRILYFGDMDYEGIGIYENLTEIFRGRWEIEPFLPAYRAMLKKAESVESLPRMKEQQNRNISREFFGYFSDKEIGKMQTILEQGLYIPQEILNISDYSVLNSYHLLRSTIDAV